MKKTHEIILILLIACAISAGLQIGLTAKYDDWLSADGVITDIEFHRSRMRRGSRYSYEIYYEYTVDGVSYSGVNAYSGRETERYVGEAVTVWYDPDHHDDASFHPPGPGLWPTVPFILGISLAMRLMKTKTRKGKKKYGPAKR